MSTNLVTLPIKAHDIAKLCQGVLVSTGDNHEVRSLLTDSRKLSHVGTAAFFAINGANHDGHEYITDLIDAGVTTFIIEQEIELPETRALNIIKVGSSLKALQALAIFKRSLFKAPVVGITGSNGKTIVKEWLSSMVDAKLRVIKSPRSYNSQLGVALSVWEVSEAHELGIFEAGISQMGEMERLQQIIKPTHGIITNIGTAHEEGFPSMQEKLREKLRLFRQCEWLVFRNDQELIRNEVQPLLDHGVKGFSWAMEGPADLEVSALGNQVYQFSSKAQEFSLQLPFTDAASVENLLHCIAMMLLLGFTHDELQAEISGLDSLQMRLKLNKGINQTYVIDDSYNNDLAGLQTALDFLQHQQQYDKKTVILSDLLQVNDKDDLFAEISSLLQSKQVDQLWGIGPQMMAHGHKIGIPTRLFPDTQSFLDALPSLGLYKQVVLVKGARPFHFERIVSKLVEKAHQTIFEVDLDAITHNLNYYRNLLKPGVKTMVMVKAFAYGSGSAEIAQLLQFHKVHYLAVAYADEGITLRNNGIRLPIMVLNTSRADYDVMAEYDLEPEIFSAEQLTELANTFTRHRQVLPIHININTGMNRLGFEPDELDELVTLLKSREHIHIKSVFTHLAGADEALHNDFSQKQLDQFQTLAAHLESELGYKITKHVLNSAGIQRFPNHQFDMVRLGIGLYGLEATGTHADKLRAVGSLKTVVSQVKDIKAGETVGYSRKGVATKDMRIATVAIGYADGFSRAFSNGKGYMKINGQMAPVIGNVCMDMTMLDVTGISVSKGDEVVVFGDSPTMQELAAKIDTIPYEILTNVSERVKRVYLTE